MPRRRACSCIPLAFGILVLAKGYSVAKSALVPALVDDTSELVRANSRLALVSVIATTVGGVPAFALQQVFGPEWSLRFAFVVFVIGGILALKIPQVRIEQTAQEASSSVRSCTSRASCWPEARWR